MWGVQIRSWWWVLRCWRSFLGPSASVEDLVHSQTGHFMFVLGWADLQWLWTQDQELDIGCPSV